MALMRRVLNECMNQLYVDYVEIVFAALDNRDNFHRRLVRDVDWNSGTKPSGFIPQYLESGYFNAERILVRLSLASPNNILVFSLKNNGLSTPA